MNVADKLRKIENEFPVDSIQVNNENIWPLFRLFIYNQLLEGLIMVFPKGFNTLFRKLINASFKWWRWFGRGDYIIFSNEMERKSEGDVVIDKLAEGIIRELGYHQSLYIEQVKEHHLNGTAYGKKRVVSYDLILLLAGLWKKIQRPGYKATVVGTNVCDQIIKTYGLKDNFKEMLDNFFSKVIVLQFIFRLKKPKAIFITDYGNLSIIFAAKKLGIPIIEFQHGVIGHEHPYYHPAKPLDFHFRPDYILVFGRNDVDGLSHGNYIPRKNIIPIGNCYLKSLIERQSNNEILEMLKGYERSICVPTDFYTHEYLVDFVCEVSRNLPEYIFIISPRQSNVSTDQDRMPDNVKIVLKHSFQEIVRHCDFNTSTNSTCCLEAISLGAQNILIDEDGCASQYFGKVLIDKNITRFAKSKEDYIRHMKTIRPMAKSEVSSSSSRIYSNDNDVQIKEVVRLVKSSNHKL